jgi:DNA (cytosine-5)-methyltransferase 1
MRDHDKLKKAERPPMYDLLFGEEEVDETSIEEGEEVEAVSPSDNSVKTLAEVRQREEQIRKAANIKLSSGVASDTFPKLILPKRWEILSREAEVKKVPLKPLIVPVENSLDEIRRELRRIEETGMGKLYVMSGSTGTGKTTFLNSLQNFLDSIEVCTISEMNLERRESVKTRLASLHRKPHKFSIVVLEGKETPGTLKDDEIDILLTALNADFRSEVGRRTLFVIPTTEAVVAQSISYRAATIGGMTSHHRPFHVFSGPPKSKYYSIANDTVQALNDARTLLEYGISEQHGQAIAEASPSIGAFIESCYNKIEEQRDRTEALAIDIKRKRIHLWMVFCSTEEKKTPRRNHDIIRALTTGDDQRAQVNRILKGDSKAARTWEGKENILGQASQYLDLRIMYLPLRTATAIATAYGHKEFIEHLKTLKLDNGDPALQKATHKGDAQRSLTTTAIIAFLSGQGFTDPDPSKRGSLTPQQQALFKALVELTHNDDKAANAMIAQTLRDWNKDPENKVVTELPLNEAGTLSTDIAFVTPTEIYCLEIKWRSRLLTDGMVVQATLSRISDFVNELPELRTSFGGIS